MTDQSEDQGVGLTLTDVDNAIKVIDHAAEQGAFKGWHVIEGVQKVRARLNNFLTAAKAAQQAAAEEATENNT